MISIEKQSFNVIFKNLNKLIVFFIIILSILKHTFMILNLTKSINVSFSKKDLIANFDFF